MILLIDKDLKSKNVRGKKVIYYQRISVQKENTVGGISRTLQM